MGGSLRPSSPLAVAGAGLLVLWGVSRRRRLAVALAKLVRSVRECILPTPQPATALEALIGNTPLVELKSLSRLTGCTILGKCEFLNPGGSVKDRVAMMMVKEAQGRGKLREGGTLYEGTAGSTGISLAMVCRSQGLNCCIYMPDDQAKEKSDMLSRLGATVRRVRPVSIIDPEQYCNVAESQAKETDGFYADQFENLANTRAHYMGTGPEIWAQSGGDLDAFVYLKDMAGDAVQTFLVDPPGSSLYNRVRRGVAFAPEEKEGQKSRHQVDTITEGIGINRITRNFLEAKVDGAFRGTDQEAVDMAGFLLQNEGLFIGSSSAMNCVGAVKVARKLGPGHRIATILCDHGQRHLSQFHNPEFLHAAGLHPARQFKDLRFVS